LSLIKYQAKNVYVGLEVQLHALEGSVRSPRPHDTQYPFNVSAGYAPHNDVSVNDGPHIRWCIFCMINIILLTNFVNFKYNIYYTGTDTYNYKLLLIECHYFYSKLILTILMVLGLSRKTLLPYLSKKSYRRHFNKNFSVF
jgi:hypothetical protein